MEPQTIKSNCLSRTAVFIAVTIVLISTCHCAPTNHMKNTATKELWWHNPCTVTRTRHQREAQVNRHIFKALKDQLKKVLQDFNSTLDGFEYLYGSRWLSDIQINEKEFEDTLPKGPNKKTSDSQTYFAIHTDVQKYAAALEKLLRLKIVSQNQDNGARKKLLNNTKNYMKLLLCEVETVFNNTNEKTLEKVPLSEDNKLSDHTTSLAKDKIFLNRYHGYLKRLQVVLSKMKIRKNRNNKKNPKGKKRKRTKTLADKSKNASASSSSSAASSSLPESPKKPSIVKTARPKTLKTKQRKV